MKQVTARSLLCKSRYIQLIHIAKAQLKIDDEAYRSMLMALTGKTSSKELSLLDLDCVLQRLKGLGFTPIAKKVSAKNLSPKSSDKKVKTQLDKLRSLWIAMERAGYLQNGSEQGLLNWSKAQVKRSNKNVAVEKLEWLTPYMLHDLIEQLKQWQKRCELGDKNG